MKDVEWQTEHFVFDPGGNTELLELTEWGVNG